MKKFAISLLSFLFIFSAHLPADPSSSKREIDDLLMKARTYFDTSLAKVLELAEKALILAKKEKDDHAIARSFNTIGDVYSNWNKFELSLDFYLKSLKIFENLKFKNGLERTLLKIGNVYHQINKHQKALEYYNQASEIARSVGNTLFQSTCFINIGSIYEFQGKFDMALNYYKNALSINDNTDDFHQRAIIFLNIGNINYIQKKSDWFTYYKKAIDIAEQNHYSILIGTISNDLAEKCLAKGDLSNAFEHLKKAEDYAQKTGQKDAIKKNLELFSLYYQQKKDFAKALDYYKKFFNVYSEIFSKQSNDKLLELQEAYQSEKKEKQIAVANLRLGQEKSRRRILYLVICLILALLGLVAGKLRKFFRFWKKSSYIGDYLLLDRIAVGGMGTVYKGRHKVTKNIAAVKIMRDEFYQDLNLRKRFNNEAQIIKALSHDNIVRFIDRGESESKLFIIMEYLDGETLTVWLKKNRLNKITDRLSIIMQLSDAINYLHSRLIMHRDLKPDNIMLTGPKRVRPLVKLLDFGIAKGDCQTRLTHTGDVMGTTNYIAPEIIMGAKPAIAGDIFALGVIFYEILTNRRLFEADSATVIIDKICNEIPAAPIEIDSGIPAGLSSLVMAMIEKDPQCRPTASQVAHNLKVIFFDLAPASLLKREEMMGRADSILSSRVPFSRRGYGNLQRSTINGNSRGGADPAPTFRA